MIADIITSRRAVFPSQYNEDTISKQEIDTILSAANWAPTHRRTEPWRFKVFYGESLQKLGEFLADTYERTAVNFSEFKMNKILKKTAQSACIIAICFQRDAEEKVPEWEEIAATAMAVQNMWLQAHAMGIGAYWSSPALKDHLRDHIDLAEGEQCLGFFYMGKYDGPLEEGRRETTIEEKTNWI